MVYSNKFVMCVLHNGTVQKELANGVVKLPFSAEYTLRFRNKNNRRAVVKIYLDGENVSGNGYVIPANDYVDIKRHHDKDAAFKFVSLESPDAVEFGKDGPNHDKVKGLVEAHFYLEKEQAQPIYKEVHHHHHHDHYHPRVDPWPKPWNPYPIRPLWCNTGSGDTSNDQYKTSCHAGGSSASLSRSRSVSKGMAGLEGLQSNDYDHESQTLGFCSAGPAPELKDGCTVEGFSTGQQFSTTYIETEDTYTSLKIFLQGFEKEVEEAKPKSRWKPHKTVKDHKLDSLEAENEELRKKLAEIENQQLKKKLEELEAK